VGLQEQNKVGTPSLAVYSLSGQIDQLEVSKDVSEIVRVAAYNHPNEIWCLTCSPHDRDLLITAYNTGLYFFFALPSKCFKW
jgi:hypothetical protein